VSEHGNKVIKLISRAAIPPGSVHRVDVAGVPPLAVYNIEGNYFVTNDTCTHGNASLTEGLLEGDEIVCPLHDGRFCIRTGEAVGYPATIPLHTYEVTIVEDQICIDLPPTQ
jgi:nitrite reductase/ring-hydroxylating ferredoxin subunit